MLKVFAKENVCKCLFYIKSMKSRCCASFFLVFFLRTSHEQVLLEMEGLKFLILLDLHFILLPLKSRLLVM